VGVWLVDADVLARSRFAVSALTETVVALLRLPGDLRHDPLAVELVTAMRTSHWMPDALVAPPGRRDTTFAQELARLRRRDTRTVQADLAITCGGRLSPLLDTPDVVQRVATLVERVWIEQVAPDWERTRKLFEADIVRRSHRISSDGWVGAIAGMSPRLSWLGDGQLRINAWDSPPRHLGGSELIFVPSSSRGGWVSWELPSRYAVVYPAAGLLAVQPAARDDAVERLIGLTRARLLRQTVAPMSTSQLAAATGLGIGSVGDHLRVLLDAQLVSRRRSGSSVLYQQSDLAAELLRADLGP